MSRDDARAHHASNASGSEGTIALGTGIGSNMIFASRSPSPSLSNGSSPVTHWYAMTASAQRSERWSIALVPRACSGLM